QPGAGAVVERAIQEAEFVGDSSQLPHQGGAIDHQPRPKDPGQRNDGVQSQRLGGEHRDAPSRRQAARILQPSPEAIEIAADRLAFGTLDLLALEPFQAGPDAILEFDKVLGAPPVARLELEITGDYPLSPR